MKVRTNLVISTAQIEGKLPPQLEAYRIFRSFQSKQISKYWISISNFLTDFRPNCKYFK